MRLGRIAAHDDHGLGLADVVVAVRHRAVAPGIGDAGDGGRVTDTGLVIDVVGAPEGRELAEQIGAFVGELGGAEPVHRLLTGLGADFAELVADLVDRDIPGNAGPLPVHQLHRIAQAPVAVHQFAHRGALGAVRTAVDRAVPGRLLADPDAVRDLTDHRAADRTMRADVLADGDLRAGSRRRTGFGLAHAHERQRADGGERAGGETGAAQEGTAVERAARLRGKRTGERSAAGLTFCSFDQHVRVSPQAGYLFTR